METQSTTKVAYRLYHLTAEGGRWWSSWTIPSLARAIQEGTDEISSGKPGRAGSPTVRIDITRVLYEQIPLLPTGDVSRRDIAFADVPEGSTLTWATGEPSGGEMPAILQTQWSADAYLDSFPDAELWRELSTPIATLDAAGITWNAGATPEERAQFRPATYYVVSAIGAEGVPLSEPIVVTGTLSNVQAAVRSLEDIGAFNVATITRVTCNWEREIVPGRRGDDISMCVRSTDREAREQRVITARHNGASLGTYSGPGMPDHLLADVRQIAGPVDIWREQVLPIAYVFRNGRVALTPQAKKSGIVSSADAGLSISWP